MLVIKRSPKNPILTPNGDNSWESEAAFNPSVVEERGSLHMVYRAVSGRQNRSGAELEVSSIGHAVSRDGITFESTEQVVYPEKDWEKFGCEDPRITKFEGAYFIFYTALSKYPFSAEGIRVGLAITKNFKTFEKHSVTPFNAKAMALFPERINGKIAAVLTVNTDVPPAKICLAFFESIEDIWSEEYWKTWYKELDRHLLDIPKTDQDQVEVGAPPLKTKNGWLLFYSYIYNYFSPPVIFGVQAVLLDLKNPLTIVGKVKRPFFVPTEEYELYGRVPNVVFPSGAIIRNQAVYLYYGAADTTSCVAVLKLNTLIEQLLIVKEQELNRFEGNPIIAPIAAHPWEAKATFNPAALSLGGRVHLLYRAMSEDNTSVFGYASSIDGVHIADRLSQPVYVPREKFESKLISGVNSGCEDPRVTLIGETIYMCYTAFDGKNSPRVALTSISKNDFLSKNWNWAKPVLISPPGVDDKDAAIFPKKIKGKYAILHRLGVSIWLEYVDDIEFKNEKFLGGKILMDPRETMWDSKRIGIAGPPLETKFGWLLFYHGISKRNSHYSVRVALLDKNDPSRILYRIRDQILEPNMLYEKEGVVPNVVFSCGEVVIKNEIFLYYGAADTVIGVATISLKDLTDILFREAKFYR